MVWIVYKFFEELSKVILTCSLALAKGPTRVTEMKVVKVISSDAALHQLPHPDQIKISFQDGFLRNRLAVLINGKKVYDGTLTTHPVYGHAMSIVHSMQGSQLTLELAIDGKAYRAKVLLKNGPYLAVEKQKSSVRVLQSTQPFAYELQK